MGLPIFSLSAMYLTPSCDPEHLANKEEIGRAHSCSPPEYLRAPLCKLYESDFKNERKQIAGDSIPVVHLKPALGV